MRSATQADAKANLHLYAEVGRELGISPWLVLRVVMLFALHVLRATSRQSYCAIPFLGTVFLKYNRRVNHSVFTLCPDAYARMYARLGGFPSDPTAATLRKRREVQRMVAMRPKLQDPSVEKLEALMYRDLDWACNKHAAEET